MPHSMKRKNWPSLPVMLILLLTACNPTPAPGCLASVHAQPSVKAWFKAQTLPPDVLDYLNKVGAEQAAIDATCSPNWLQGLIR